MHLFTLLPSADVYKVLLLGEHGTAGTARTTEFMPAKPLRWMPRFASFVSWPRSAEKVPSKSAVPCKRPQGTDLSCHVLSALGLYHHVLCDDDSSERF